MFMIGWKVIPFSSEVRMMAVKRFKWAGGNHDD
jgi:hypothetical protein